MLPTVVRWLGLNRLGHKERKDEIKSELHARQAALKEVTKRLEQTIKDAQAAEGNDRAFAHAQSKPLADIAVELDRRASITCGKPRR